MNTVRGRSCGKVNSAAKFQSVFSHFAALAGDYKDEWDGPSSVVKTQSLWEVTRIKWSPGSA